MPMQQKIQKTTVPLYAVAALWLLRAITGNLHSFGQILGTIALSVLLYIVMRLFFPDKVVKEEEKDEKKEEKTEAKAEKAPPKEETELEKVLRQGRESVAQIRSLNDEIPDFKLTAKIRQIELLTEKIFDFVCRHPENLKQIRQFLDYYLPTTIKLLGQYVELQNQQYRAGNIDEGMRKIEDMLDTVIVAFQKLLDSLFESSVVDITADIQVMEKLMTAEGLNGKKDF